MIAALAGAEAAVAEAGAAVAAGETAVAGDDVIGPALPVPAFFEGCGNCSGRF